MDVLGRGGGVASLRPNFFGWTGPGVLAGSGSSSLQAQVMRSRMHCTKLGNGPETISFSTPWKCTQEDASASYQQLCTTLRMGSLWRWILLRVSREWLRVRVPNLSCTRPWRSLDTILHFLSWLLTAVRTILDGGCWRESQAPRLPPQLPYGGRFSVARWAPQNNSKPAV